MKTIVAYISAHGFGHWAQMAPVLRALHRRDAGMRIVLRTGLPRAVLQARAGFPFELAEGQVDVGVIQRDAVHEDIPATIAAVEAFHRDWDARVGLEAQMLQRIGAELVLSDIAPLAFAAASAAKLPSIGIASIDWHGIYAALLPEGHPALAQIAAAHHDCHLLLRLPLDMPMPSFPRQRPIGLVAARSAKPRQELRQALHQHLGGYAETDRVALVMFGGSGMPAFRIEALADVDGWRFVVPAAPDMHLPANVRAMPDGWAMPDLIAACDAVVCKPGYGIISEAWMAERPLVYVPRPGFPEYPYLKRWLAAHAPACELDLDAFERGKWGGALQAAVSMTRRYPPCAAGGEGEAAALIHAALAGI